MYGATCLSQHTHGGQETALVQDSAWVLRLHLPPEPSQQPDLSYFYSMCTIMFYHNDVFNGLPNTVTFKLEFLCRNLGVGNTPLLKQTQRMWRDPVLE